MQQASSKRKGNGNEAKKKKNPAHFSNSSYNVISETVTTHFLHLCITATPSPTPPPELQCSVESDSAFVLFVCCEAGRKWALAKPAPTVEETMEVMLWRELYGMEARPILSAELPSASAFLLFSCILFLASLALLSFHFLHDSSIPSTPLLGNLLCGVEWSQQKKNNALKLKWNEMSSLKVWS